MSLITLKSYTYLHDADLIRARLQIEGIECYLADEMTASVNPLYTSALGGIRLQVHDSDAQKAVSLMQQWGEIEIVPPQNNHSKLNGYAQNGQVSKNRNRKNLILAALLIAIVTIIVYGIASM